MSRRDTFFDDTQFMQAIIGSIYPDIKAPQPPPPKKQHHGGFFSILVEAIVTVVACIVAPELVAVILPNLIAGTLTTAVITGVTAGLLDAAGQGLAVGLGIEEKFSLSDVIACTVTAGFAEYGNVAKIGETVSERAVEGVGKAADLSAKGIAAAAFKQGVAAATSQLIGLATGAISKFDIKSIATAMATQAIDLKMNVPDTAGGFFKDSMSTLNQVAINAAARGRLPDNLEELAAQYLGTEIGKHVVEGVGYMIENHAQSEQQKAHPEAGQDASKRDPVSDGAKAKKQTAETQDAAKTKSAAGQKSAGARDGTEDEAASDSSGQARKAQASKAAKDKESDSHKTSSSANSRKSAAATKSGHSAHVADDAMASPDSPEARVAKYLDDLSDASIEAYSDPLGIRRGARNTLFGSGSAQRSATTATPTPSSVTTEPGASSAMVKAEVGSGKETISSAFLNVAKIAFAIETGLAQLAAGPTFFGYGRERQFKDLATLEKEMGPNAIGFAERPFRPIESSGIMIKNPFSHSAHIDAAHEIIFRTDGNGKLHYAAYTGKERGVQTDQDEMGRGVRAEEREGSKISEYRVGPIYHNVHVTDEILHPSGFAPSDYNFFTHNCQDYADTVRQELHLPQDMP